MFLSLMFSGQLLKITNTVDHHGYPQFTIISRKNIPDHQIILANFRLHIFLKNKNGFSYEIHGKQTYHLAYLSMLLITIANDINLNPGPDTTVFLCGTCDEPVTWEDKVSSRTYNILVEDSAIAWDYLVCDCPNYSSVCFDIVLSISNSFSILSDTSLQSTFPSDCIKPIHSSTPDRKKQYTSPKSVPIKMLIVNRQSIKSKQELIKNLVESIKPDIVLGTETWIDSSVKDNQIFPPNYNIYRNHRNMKGGGVLIAINHDHLNTPVPELHTNCEIV
ncbi:Hypothetical predicted protein [Mytilus galloprovincialis]|uniref:Endonuclease/exonuclease/phosphatase domain-containing protein n=1 Tax=Mytilus galloprovincialis TaxID=29158 RepID=A0A8B6FGU8_MYTGA|nr:Hypothetical predicted protein [Mytilus galloprovincialis]